ncbi:MAG: acyl-ACP--UDP-N-acetylglucosamine O-acyltransferase [Pseudomonadales bacterium]|nr:acyl-ACP--UDP-N-acetylglucosamine O-acyltransferase [Pseudomonadales bacterium]MCP5182838.1 acyl-ACP--UDP-N-acetylglucosamine O-acyltransferase [Pseudomonadales bacterium]
MIDGRAIIDPRARIGNNVEIGPWTIVGADVEIGDGTHIASHVVLKGPTRIGRNNRIYQFATVGEDTPALAYGGEPTWLEIGDNNVIREGVTIHRGLVQDQGRTIIGNHCLLMAYVHVGHDCVVGDHVIMANNASIAGHVIVGEHANFGGYSGVAQFRRVGAHAHIAAMSLVIKDVPAYMTVAGNPANVIGLNLEGMRRRGFDKAVLQAVKDAHRLLYRSGLTASDAQAQIDRLAREFPAVAVLLDSVRDSRWGIVRPRTQPDPE